MKINIEELQKQRKEAILKSGKYCKAEIVIGKNDHSPIMCVDAKHVGAKEIALLMLSLRETIVDLAKKKPFAYYIMQNLKIETQLIIEEDDIDKHIPKID